MTLTVRIRCHSSSISFISECASVTSWLGLQHALGVGDATGGTQMPGYTMP